MIRLILSSPGHHAVNTRDCVYCFAYRLVKISTYKQTNHVVTVRLVSYLYKVNRLLQFSSSKCAPTNFEHNEYD